MMTSGRTLDNRYIIREEIGSGGFGAVYLAEDTRFTGNNHVAIKKILQSNEITDRAFRHEANLLYNLSHPNLPKVTNCFQEDGANYIVMNFIAGEDLMDQLKKEKIFSVSEVLEIADKVLFALEYLHSFLIFHRDIKPHNIKIDGDNNIFLLDFGTAKGQTDEITLSLTDQSITGFTPFYAPLEQVLRVDANSYLLLQSLDSPNLEKFVQNKTDARSDVYGLGATIYHLLTGFSPERATATIRAHLIWSGKSDPLPDCRCYNSEISENLAEIINKSLAIDPEERFQTAAQFRSALKNLTHTKGIENESAADVEMVQASESSPIIDFNLNETVQSVIIPSDFKANVPLPPSKAKMKTGAFFILPVLFFALAGFGGWFILSDTTKPSPKIEVIAERQPTSVTKSSRSFIYSLLVQKMRDGRKFQEPFESSGQEIFESGYEFQMRFIPSDTGFLYVFNEGLDKKGEKIFTVQFPTPSANSGVSDVLANQSYKSSWLEFGGTPGTENFWISWNKTENRELEAARENAFQNEGVVVDNDLKATLKKYLENSEKIKTEVVKDVEKKLTRIDFEGDSVIYLLQLEHR